MKGSAKRSAIAATSSSARTASSPRPVRSASRTASSRTTHSGSRSPHRRAARGDGAGRPGDVDPDRHRRAADDEVRVLTRAETGAASILQLNLGRVGACSRRRRSPAWRRRTTPRSPHISIAARSSAPPTSSSARAARTSSARRDPRLGRLPRRDPEDTDRVGGRLRDPADAPGLGVELDEEVALRHPYEDDDLHLTPVYGPPTESAPRYALIRAGTRAPATASRERLRAASPPSVTTPSCRTALAREGRSARPTLRARGALRARRRARARSPGPCTRDEREADVVAAVQDDLALGLVDEARCPELARITSNDCARSSPPRRASIRASPAATRWMNASMLVITLITDAATERADMEDLVADRLERRPVVAEKASADPPTSTVIRPTAARWTPPVTGASRH